MKPTLWQTKNRGKLNVFRQTLLSAYEIKLNFDRQLAPLLSLNDPLASAASVLVTENEEV